jgi:hypothetical protein
MNTSITLSPEAQSRVNEALTFDGSEARKVYSAQRIKNAEEDIDLLFANGVEKLQAHGSSIVANIFAIDSNE